MTILQFIDSSPVVSVTLAGMVMLFLLVLANIVRLTIRPENCSAASEGDEGQSEGDAS